jgi:hypothetical protein
VCKCSCFPLQRRRDFDSQYRSVSVETPDRTGIPGKLCDCREKICELHLDECRLIRLLVGSELRSNGDKKSRNPRRKYSSCWWCRLQGWALGRTEKSCKYLSDKMDTEANSVPCQIIVRAERGNGTNIASGRHMLTTLC